MAELDLGWCQGYMALQYHLEDAYTESNMDISLLSHELYRPPIAIFARQYYNEINALDNIKTHDYCFIGSFESSYENRRWVLDFVKQHFTSNSIFINTYYTPDWQLLGDFDYSDKQLGFCPKHHDQSRKSQYRIVQENLFYFNSMKQSRFVLCPAGDTSWSFRFYEVLMCKSIPIVESWHHTYRTAEESVIKYKYVLCQDIERYVQDKRLEEYTNENTQLFEKYHLLHPVNAAPESCISYIAGGLFGDFFHQLSIIKENHIATGKRGILYISNIGEPFRLGLENTYEKTYDLIISQDYIKDYKLHNGEHCDINLSLWRNNWLLYSHNWYIIFRDTYGLEWGKHKWIDVPKLDIWADKIIINEPAYRVSKINYQQLYDKYKEKLVFVAFKSTNYSDYEAFTEKTGLDVQYYNPANIVKLATIINSCELFVGSPSGMMAIAFAVKANILLGRPPCNSEYAMVRTLPDHFSNIVLDESAADSTT